MELIGLFVCTECIDDSGIRDFIDNNAIEAHCSFCDGKSNDSSVAFLDEVTKYMETCLMNEYDDAANHFGYEGREGGYIGETWDTYELLLDVIELDLPTDNDGRLLREIVYLLPEFAWCEASGYGLSDQDRSRYSWAHFCEVVMHRRRFFFANEEDDIEIYSPGEVLEKLFEDAQKYNLVKFLPVGTKLFRARFQEPGTKLTTVQELGPPPKILATQSNRMSPPGIPMFYACEDPETSLRETANGEGQFTIGHFETRRPAIILDLTGIPPVPSLFQEISDSLEFYPRDVLDFLNHIAREMSKPIKRDDRVHINYTPTQVVTEFVRSKLTSNGSRIDGIKYSSAVHPGSASYVIFATQENLVQTLEGPTSPYFDQWLDLITHSEHYVTRKHIEYWQAELPSYYVLDYQKRLYGD